MKKRNLFIALALSALLVGCGGSEPAPEPAAPVQQRETGLVDLTALDKDNRKAKINDMMTDPDRYEGVVVKVSGKAKKYRDAGLNEDFYMVLTTWEDEPQGFCYTLAGGEYPKSGSIVTLTGILSNYTREVDGESVTYTELKESKILEEIPEEVTPAPTTTPAPTAVPVNEAPEIKETSLTEPMEIKEENKAEDKSEDSKESEKDSKDNK